MNYLVGPTAASLSLFLPLLILMIAVMPEGNSSVPLGDLMEITPHADSALNATESFEDQTLHLFPLLNPTSSHSEAMQTDTSKKHELSTTNNHDYSILKAPSTRPSPILLVGNISLQLDNSSLCLVGGKTNDPPYSKPILSGPTGHELPESGSPELRL